MMALTLAPQRRCPAARPASTRPTAHGLWPGRSCLAPSRYRSTIRAPPTATWPGGWRLQPGFTFGRGVRRACWRHQLPGLRLAAAVRPGAVPAGQSAYRPAPARQAAATARTPKSGLRRNWPLGPNPGPITYRDRARSSDTALSSAVRRASNDACHHPRLRQALPQHRRLPGQRQTIHAAAGPGGLALRFIRPPKGRTWGRCTPRGASGSRPHCSIPGGHARTT